jgi:hypothetical protein
MSANALAFSQENPRFPSCQGQTTCKLRYWAETIAPSASREVIAVWKRDPDGREGIVPCSHERLTQASARRHVTDAWGTRTEFIERAP